MAVKKFKPNFSMNNEDNICLFVLNLHEKRKVPSTDWEPSFFKRKKLTAVNAGFKMF